VGQWVGEDHGGGGTSILNQRRGGAHCSVPAMAVAAGAVVLMVADQRRGGEHR
jgi:hypothetical protein